MTAEKFKDSVGPKDYDGLIMWKGFQMTGYRKSWPCESALLEELTR